jgi:DNA-binding HxlR family transcriptional regulator
VCGAPKTATEEPELAGEHDVLADLISVVGVRHGVEVLDALEECPRSFAELRKVVLGRRRDLDRALLTLADCAAIRRSGPSGTWDDRAVPDTRFSLTSAGRHLADQLSQLDVLTMVYDDPLLGRRPPE